MSQKHQVVHSSQQICEWSHPRDTRCHVHIAQFPVVYLTQLTCTRLQPNGFHFSWHCDDNPDVQVPPLYCRFTVFIHIRFRAEILDCPYGRPFRFSNSLFTFSVVRYWTHALSNSDDPRPRPDHTLEDPLMLECANNSCSSRANFKQFACQWHAAFSHTLTIASVLLDEEITCYALQTRAV